MMWTSSVDLQDRWGHPMSQGSGLAAQLLDVIADACLGRVCHLRQTFNCPIFL